MDSTVRQQCSNRLDEHTRKQVCRGNSYLNWPTNVGGLLVLRFERPSQSWINSLVGGLPGAGSFGLGNQPIKVRYKIDAFEHNI